MRLRTILVLCAALAVGVASGASAAPASNIVVKATLTGKYLHTSSTGHGTVMITMKPTSVCWKFTYRGLDQGGDSGIHIVPPPAAGKHKHSVFPFTASTSTAPGRVSKTRWGPSGPSWVDKIVADPSRFYVIVATKKYPQGAIGGVLRPG